jgi:hypothetical protein
VKVHGCCWNLERDSEGDEDSALLAASGFDVLMLLVQILRGSNGGHKEIGIKPGFASGLGLVCPMKQGRLSTLAAVVAEPVCLCLEALILAYRFVLTTSPGGLEGFASQGSFARPE